MHFHVLGEGTAAVVECKSPLSKVSDAVDLVTACYQHGTNRLLLDAEVLPQAFFELRTLFAGEFLQKLQNYQIRTAVVIPSEGHYSERFREYLHEARRGHSSRVFPSREEALEWLAGDVSLK